jgi:hypothetical protein
MNVWVVPDGDILSHICGECQIERAIPLEVDAVLVDSPSFCCLEEQRVESSQRSWHVWQETTSLPACLRRCLDFLVRTLKILIQQSGTEDLFTSGQAPYSGSRKLSFWHGAWQVRPEELLDRLKKTLDFSSPARKADVRKDPFSFQIGGHLLHMSRSKIAAMIGRKNARDTTSMPAWIIFAPDRLMKGERRLECSWR